MRAIFPPLFIYLFFLIMKSYRRNSQPAADILFSLEMNGRLYFLFVNYSLYGNTPIYDLIQ